MVDGVPLPEEWYKWASENNVPGISIVDQGSAISLFSSVRNKENTVAVSGVGLNVNDYNEDSPPGTPFSISAWAISDEGYKNLESNINCLFLTSSFNVFNLNSLSNNSKEYVALIL